MPTILRSPQLTPAQITQYQRDGFIAFEEVLSSREVAAAKDALNDILEALRPQQQITRNDYGAVWADAHSKQFVQFQRGHEQNTTRFSPKPMARPPVARRRRSAVFERAASTCSELFCRVACALHLPSITVDPSRSFRTEF